MPESSSLPIGRFLQRLTKRPLLGARRHEHQRAMADVAFINASGQFDRPGYLQRYPDVAREGTDPVLHYVLRGASEGRDPASWFDTDFYVRKYPDIAASGMNPFRHFIEHGKPEGRSPAPAIPKAKSAARPKVDDTRKEDFELIRHSGFFDPAWYLKKNPDVAAAGMSPLRHFTRYGWKELRDPSPQFNMAWYWLTQQAQAGIEGNPLAHYLTRTDAVPRRNLLRSAGKLTTKDREFIAGICADLLAREGLDFSTLSRVGRAMSALPNWELAEEAWRRAVELDWDTAASHYRLAKVLAARGRWWQAVESLERAVTLNPAYADWHFALGEAQEKMNRSALAAQAFRNALEMEPFQAAWYYRLGYCLEQSGQSEEAQQAYAKAIEVSTDELAKRLGIGYFHQKRGYWNEAAQAYLQQASEHPLDALVQYRLGFAHDRCYRWKEALEAYRAAISLNPVGEPYWHYRCGFVLERLERWMEAARAYGAASLLSTTEQPYWRYRQGYVLAAAGNHELACLAYMATRYGQTVDGRPYVPDVGVAAAANNVMADLPIPNGRGSAHFGLATYLASFDAEAKAKKALAVDFNDAQAHYWLGVACELKQDWEGAAEAYADAVARENEHRPLWYYRLGFVLFQAGRFEMACRAFCETRILRRPFGVDLTKFEGTDTQSLLASYNEYVATLPVRRDVVVYESLHGATVGSNPYAIFEQLLGDPQFSGWRHVWVVDNKNIIPKHLRSRSNVIFAQRGSDLYRRYLATAGYLINDVTFPFWFTRRPEQKYLNTWHGTPLKSMGKEIPGEFMVHGNIQRNLLQATHLISPNRHTSDILMRCYDIQGIFGGKLAELGYPRIDRSLRATEADKRELRNRLGLDEHRPVVLYAPTWRGEHGQAEFDVEQLRSDIKRLSGLQCQLLFRGHHMVEKLIVGMELPVAIAPQEIDTSEVLSIADCLITDYSSIAFDFLPLKRPIFYYCSDLEAYKSRRGLCLEMETMPGTLCRNMDELDRTLASYLNETSRFTDVDYVEQRQTYCPMEDGNASQRAVAFFFNGEDRYEVKRYSDARRSLLFYNGHFPPNGITASFLNLMENLCRSGDDQITVAIDPHRIAAEPSWREKFNLLPKQVKVQNRVGSVVYSPEEKWIGARFSSRHDLDSEEMRGLFRDTYRREYRRIFGNARIDAVINFEGYNVLWSALLDQGAGGLRSVAYLHNDMVEEFQLKHMYLKSLFRLYHDYDKLVSVSERMCAVNRDKMSRMFGLDKGKFRACVNSIDVPTIMDNANAAVDGDLLHWFDSKYLFLTIGRMSPEKDHAKLINAFSRVHAVYPEARLMIVGDGPLRHVLNQQIIERGLEHAICLAGQRENPFPLLRRCDCFVFPSNHEGQPMVLLEAMTLGKPVVATDIDGNRGVLEDGYGMLVENSAEGLENGMTAFIEGRVECKAFDATHYAQQAVAMFHDVVMGSRRNAEILRAAGEISA